MDNRLGKFASYFTSRVYDGVIFLLCLDRGQFHVLRVARELGQVLYSRLAIGHRPVTVENELPPPPFQM